MRAVPPAAPSARRARGAGQSRPAVARWEGWPDRPTASTCHASSAPPPFSLPPASPAGGSPPPGSPTAWLTSISHSRSAWQPSSLGSSSLTARPDTRARGGDARAAGSSPGRNAVERVPGSLSPRRFRPTSRSRQADAGSKSSSRAVGALTRAASVSHRVLPARCPCSSNASTPAQNPTSPPTSAVPTSTSVAQLEPTGRTSPTAGGGSGASDGTSVVPIRRGLHGPGPARLCARTCAPYCEAENSPRAISSVPKISVWLTKIAPPAVGPAVKRTE
eukprot:scaffold18254_cov101-Isochrysis_galbana.AAC.1